MTGTDIQLVLSERFVVNSASHPPPGEQLAKICVDHLFDALATEFNKMYWQTKGTYVVNVIMRAADVPRMHKEVE